MDKFAVKTLVVLFACAQLGTYAGYAQSETDSLIVQRLDEIAKSVAEADSNFQAIEARLKEDGGFSNSTLTIMLVVFVAIIIVFPWLQPSKTKKRIEEIADYLKDADLKKVALRLENAKFEKRLEHITTIGQDVKRIADLLEKDLSDERSKKIDERLSKIDKRLTGIEETHKRGHL